MRTEMWPVAIQTSREKLTELRLKTNRDLKLLLEKGLERAFQLLGRGDTEKAERAYTQAVVLLRLMRTLPARERQRLEQAIRELSTELGQAVACK